MSTLIMMYVYFDTAGEIKSIASDPSTAFSDTYSLITTPLDEVDSFLTGRKNPFDYYVKTVSRLGIVSYKITRKAVIGTNTLRSVDTFLTELLAYNRGSDANIFVENFVESKTLKISVNPDIKTLLECGSDVEIEKLTSLVNTPLLYLFFTKKNDPHFLLKTISVSPKELFNCSAVHINYAEDLSDASVFTKKLIDGYGYITR
jgi:hypothetical protein